MKLNDVWRDVGIEIGFFTKETFDRVPTSAGVYAWFYPLRILTKDPDEFLNQVNAVFNYDCITSGEPERNIITNVGWQKIIQNIKIKFQHTDLKNFREIWNSYTASEKKFNLLRSVIMKSSIFMSPLYVGKTKNLHLRCQKHINGSVNNDFHSRYESYAKSLNLSASRVSDLLFVCIRTNEFEFEQNDNLESLVESILKSLSKPKYSKI